MTRHLHFCVCLYLCVCMYVCTVWRGGWWLNKASVIRALSLNTHYHIALKLGGSNERSRLVYQVM